MKLSELINELESLEYEFGGDLDVVVYPYHNVGAQKFISSVRFSDLIGSGKKIVLELHKETWPV